MNVVVLGGGISGLTAAYRLAVSRSTSKKINHVTLLEKSKVLGGWIQSRRQGPLNSLFELGPRSLRPVGIPGLTALKLVGELGLENSLISVKKDSAAAKNRYILLDDQVVKLPNSLMSVLKPTHHLPYLPPILLKEPRIKKNVTKDDETVFSFFSRRFSEEVAEKLASSMVHGIYAGDVTKLSVKHCFPSLWTAEQLHGSIVKSLFHGNTAKHKSTIAGSLENDLQREYPLLWEKIQNASIYSFVDGIQTITNALRDRLLSLENGATVKTGLGCSSLEREGEKIKVIMEDGTFYTADHVIAAIPSSVLSHLIKHHIPDIDAVSVVVVNVAFQDAKLLDHIPGFGFLNPRRDSPLLGVVFDSWAISGQDDIPHTKVTVMLAASRMRSKDKDYCLGLALSAISKYLGIKDEPISYRVTINDSCIPQYEVGHSDKLRAVHQSLVEMQRISVLGSSWLGVSVNDCIMHAEKLATGLIQNCDDAGLQPNLTGIPIDP